MITNEVAFAGMRPSFFNFQFPIFNFQCLAAPWLRRLMRPSSFRPLAETSRRTNAVKIVLAARRFDAILTATGQGGKTCLGANSQ